MEDGTTWRGGSPSTGAAPGARPDDSYARLTYGWSEERKERFPPERFVHLAETGSTNDDLIHRARRGEAVPFDLLLADRQHAGRGRRGHVWESGPARNLLFSLALRLPDEPRHWTRLPHLTARLVGAAIESILPPGQRLQSKWPNDLLYRGRKLAGILVETVAHPVPLAVVGVGVNVNQREDEFPEALRPLATSLYEIVQCESSRLYLLGLILEDFLEAYPAGLESFDETLAWIAERDYLEGRRLRVDTARGRILGTARGLDTDGALLVERDDGTRERLLTAEHIELD